MDLTDAQWAVLEPVLPKPRRRPGGRGRPWRDPRWLERDALAPQDRCPLAGFARALPARSDLSSPLPAVGAPRRVRPSAPRPRRRLPRAGALGSRRRLRRRLHRWHLGHRDKRGPGVGPTQRGQGSNVMVLGDRAGLPLAVPGARAAPPETTLVEPTLASPFTAALPPRRSGDRADDSDPLDAELAAWGIELIAPPGLRARGVSSRELPRVCPARVRPHPAPAFVR